MTGDSNRLEQIERGCERLDRDEYNQGVPNHAPWRAAPSCSGPDRWIVYQPTGSDCSRIITEGMRQPFADFIAAAREDVPWLIGQLRDARAENERLRKLNDRHARNLAGLGPNTSGYTVAEVEAVEAALAAVRDWAMTNEIAAPPLDWASLGRILAAAEQDEPKRSPKLTAPRDASGSTHSLDDCPCPSCAPKQEQS